MNRMTWNDLLEFLIKLKKNGDNRINDSVIVYNITNGEYQPAELLEFDDDHDIISPNQLFLTMVDWNGLHEGGVTCS